MGESLSPDAPLPDPRHAHDVPAACDGRPATHLLAPPAVRRVCGGAAWPGRRRECTTTNANTNTNTNANANANTAIYIDRSVEEGSWSWTVEALRCLF
mmetsp:Transcript_4854/g.7959  ORF Transcript_4854/g.7959 Transcript_4854/m.7959 type:complete len:98 (+) Transcript_4854:337-630(+)